MKWQDTRKKHKAREWTAVEEFLVCPLIKKILTIILVCKSTILMQKWQIVSIYLAVSGVFLKSLHEESTEGKDEMCSFPGGTWQYAKQELTSWLVFTSRSGCSKSFKELDGEICGLLKLVNHGNPRKTCLPGETEDTDISNYGRISLT